MKLLFDIGGTKTRVTIATPNGIGEISVLPTTEDPNEALSAIDSYAAKAGTTPEAVVGGFAGTPKEDGSILISPHLPRWKDFPFGAELSRRVGAPVTIEHDASLGALGEALYGAGKGAASVAYFALGTGLGAGYVVHGAIVSPVIGFEAGHQIVDVTKGEGVDETIGGNALLKRFGARAETLPRSVYDELTPIFATAIYNTALHWHPDVVLLGGSLMNEENGFRIADIASALSRLPPLLAKVPTLKKGELGDAANLWGAFALQ